MLSPRAELSSLNNMSKAENSSCWHKPRHKLNICYSALYEMISALRNYFHVAILLFCDFVKTDNDDKSGSYDDSTYHFSRIWIVGSRLLFYVNEIKKMTKRIILKIFPKNFRLLLRCRL